MPVFSGELQLDGGHQLEMLANNAVILEIKPVERILLIREARLRSYIESLDPRLGLPIPFNVPLLKHGVRRRANHF